MVRKFDLLVFDWDGTLFDSTASIIRSIQAACRDLGLEEPSDRQAGHVIGLGLSEALSYVAPDLADERLPLLIDRYRHHYLSSDQDIRLFDGVADMIEDLHASGYCLAVATGKSRKGLDRALASSGLGRFFFSSRCADECFSKPHPQMLAELMSEFGVEEARTLMIGDTTHDLQMAINAQVPGLAVSYGAHSSESLQSLNPLGCLGSVEGLRQWLESNA
jgi:phosphoglycolate phosphatase